MNVGRPSLILKCLAASALAVTLAACSSNNTPTAPAPLTQASLKGGYVFAVSGTDPNDGDYFVAGSFVSDGAGNITSGVADYNLGSGIDANVPLTGTYSVSSGVAAVKLTDGAGVQDSFSVPLSTAGSVAISNFDSTGSGTLYMQVTTGFTPAGNYFYSLNGEGEGTVSASGNFAANSAGSFTSGTEAYTDGTVTTNQAMTGGFLGLPLAGGRGQAAIGGNNFSYYLVAPNQLILVGLDDRVLLKGTAQKQ